MKMSMEFVRNAHELKWHAHATVTRERPELTSDRRSVSDVTLVVAEDESADMLQSMDRRGVTFEWC